MTHRTVQSYDTPAPLPLLIQIHAGLVELTAADTAQTLVEVTGPGAGDVVVDLTEDGLSVIQPGRTGFLGTRHVTVRLTVPEGSQPSVRTASADLVTHGALGQSELRTASGDVTVEILAEPAVVETGSGDIAVVEAHAPLRLKSGSGDLRVGHTLGSLTVSTGSGDIRIDRSEGPVAAKTGTGDLLVRRADTDVVWQTGSGELAVARIDRGSLRAKSGSGDVRVGVPQGLPVWTDINTVTGDVSADLDPVGAPDDGADHLEVRVTSATGDVRLHQAD